MSAITLDELAESARNRLGWAPNEAPRLKTMVPSALKSLATKVARRADFEALRTEAPVNVVGGVITLNDPAILTQVLLETGELIINGLFAKPAPSFQELTLKMPNDVYRWSLRGSTKIYVKDIATGTLGTVNQAGTLAYNYVPTLVQMPDAYDKELLDEVVTLAKGETEPSSAPKFNRGEEALSVNLNAK